MSRCPYEHDPAHPQPGSPLLDDVSIGDPLPMRALLYVLATLFITATVLPLLRSDAWWVRVFDFPRAQITVLGLGVVVAGAFLWDLNSVPQALVLVAVLAGVVYQVAMMYPYTPLAREQVKPTRDTGPEESFTLLIANVLMDNRASDRFLDLVRTHDPDIILAVETDDWWERQLRPLEPAYPHTIKKPLPNTYGMLLYSRLELVDPEIRFLVEPDIPSFHAQVRLPGGPVFDLHALHPRPPYPKEDTDTTERDAELLLVGRHVKEHGRPAVVAGDLNDVAWSHTTHLFQKNSGLLDPRIGRGMFNSFDATSLFLRWPLDHVFHSEHFKLIALERLPAWGSDHFPILVRLRYDAAAFLEQEGPAVEREEEEEAKEKIEKAVRRG